MGMMPARRGTGYRTNDLLLQRHSAAYVFAFARWEVRLTITRARDFWREPEEPRAVLVLVPQITRISNEAAHIVWV